MFIHSIVNFNVILFFTRKVEKTFIVAKYLLRSKFNQTFTIVIDLANEINRLTQRRSTTLDNVRRRSLIKIF